MLPLSQCTSPPVAFSSPSVSTYLDELDEEFAGKRSSFCPVLQLIVVNTERNDLVVSDAAAYFGKYVETVNDCDLTVENNVKDLHAPTKAVRKLSCENIYINHQSNDLPVKNFPIDQLLLVCKF